MFDHITIYQLDVDKDKIREFLRAPAYKNQT